MYTVPSGISLGQAFSERPTRSFDPTLLPQVDIYLKQLLGSSHQPIDMTQKMGYLAMDIVAQFALGYNLVKQWCAENRPLAKAITVSFYVGNTSHHFPAFHKVYTNRVFNQIFYETRGEFVRLLEEVVRARLTLDTHGKHDFLSFVAHALPSEAAKMRGSVTWKETLVLQVAGGDTVATAVAPAFFYLSPNLACYARLADEIRSTSSSGRDIKGGPQLTNYRYLRACIDEALRITPLISVNLWRYFSIEPRSCVAKPLAYLEASPVVPKTLWYFDFEPSPGPLGAIGEGRDRGRTGEFCTHDGFNSTHDGPFLVFHARESTDLERDLDKSA